MINSPIASRIRVNRSEITIKKNSPAPAIPFIASNVEVGNGEGNGEARLGSGWGVEDLRSVYVEL